MQSEKTKEYQRKYREENKERLAVWRKEYYQKNRERSLASVSARYQAKKEEILQYGRDYRKANPVECYEHKKRWRAENPDASKTWSRENARKRRAQEPGFRALCSVRRRMVALIRNANAVKSRRSGLRRDTLRAHLEALFQPGMTWENYGRVWHVDHIKPCSLFDFTNPDEVAACFALSNLQPLWAAENIRKSDTYPYQPAISPCPPQT